SSYSKYDCVIISDQKFQTRKAEPNSITKISNLEMLEAKVFLNNNLSNYYYWVEDESMTSIIKYACGYLIKYLLNCKNKNQIEMIKKLKTETNPNHLLLEVKSEVFNYFRFVLIQIHVFLKYETLKKFKNEL